MEFLAVNMLSVTGGSLDLRATVVDLSGETGQVAMGDITTAGDYFFSFTDQRFINAGVDFTTVTSVQFDFETTVGGTEYQIGGITREVVPEPSVGFLAIIGSCGLAMRRRRS